MIQPKYNFIIGLSCMFLIACESQDNKPCCGNAIESIQPTGTDILLLGRDWNHDIVLPEEIGEVHVDYLNPNNLKYTILTDRIVLTPSERRVGEFPFEIKVSYDGVSEVLNGRFEVIKHDVIMDAGWMNFLVKDFDNHIAISAGKFPVDSCILYSDDSLTIEQQRVAQYRVVPHVDGIVKLKMDGWFRGVREPLGEKIFVVTDGDETVNDLMDKASKHWKK